MVDIGLLEGGIPVGVSASVDVDVDRILFDVMVEFTEPVGGDVCVWLNPGLNLEEIIMGSPYRVLLSVSKDPDMGVMTVNRVGLEIDRPVDGFRIVYQGLLRPLLMSTWGSREGMHIARCETLWYPFTISCRSILWSLLLCEHSASTLRFKLRGGFSVASSIEYRGVEDGEHVYVSRLKSGCLEFIVAPFKINSYDGVKTVSVYTLGDPLYTARQVHDVIVEVEDAFEELFSVKPPYSQYSIVFLEKTGGFKADSLIILDRDHVRNVNNLKANIAHELAHTWWGGFIKLCSPDSTWLIEAIPEYMTTLALDKLGITRRENRVEKLLRQAREISRQEGYKPPTSIWIPQNEIEDMSWRIVGEAILHEIARELGYDRFNEIIGAHMRRSIAVKNRYCLKWSEILSELKNVSERVEDILKKYTT